MLLGLSAPMTTGLAHTDRPHFHDWWCRWQPTWAIAMKVKPHNLHTVIDMKIGSCKPVVGATLVVARPRRQPIFIPLCGLHKAMVIPMKRGSGKPVVGATLVAFAPTNCHFSFGKASEGREESRHFRRDSSRSNTIVLASGGFMRALMSFEAVTVVEHG